MTWRLTSLAGFVIAGMSLFSPSLAAQQPPSPASPGSQQPTPSFTQPPDVHVLETFKKALKEGMFETMIRVPNTVCTMIVVQVDSSLDPKFVKEAPTDATTSKMPVGQPSCQSTPRKR